MPWCASDSADRRIRREASSDSAGPKSAGVRERKAPQALGSFNTGDGLAAPHGLAVVAAHGVRSRRCQFSWPIENSVIAEASRQQLHVRVDHAAVCHLRAGKFQHLMGSEQPSGIMENAMQAIGTTLLLSRMSAIAAPLLQ